MAIELQCCYTDYSQFIIRDTLSKKKTGMSLLNSTPCIPGVLPNSVLRGKSHEKLHRLTMALRNTSTQNMWKAK